MKGWTVEKENIIKAVKERDSYKCADCGRSDLLLCVHHVDNSQEFGNWEDANNNMDNLVSLCSFCHTKRHKLANGTKPLFEYREEMINMYYNGKKLRDVANQFNVTFQRVHQLFKKWGVKMRNRGIFVTG